MKKMKIKHSILLLITILAIYVWFEIPRVMIIGLAMMLSVMSFSTIVDLFKKDKHENN